MQILLGIGDLPFEVIFNYRGLFFIQHSLSSYHEIAWGGNYNETLDQTVSFPNDSPLSTETPILKTNVTLENCDEKTESLTEKQPVQSSLSAKSYASVLSLHNSGSVPIPIKTYMTELGLEVSQNAH